MVYLDGNNMLFVETRIRNLCLNKSRLKAELMLASLVREFIKSKSVSCRLV